MAIKSDLIMRRFRVSHKPVRPFIRFGAGIRKKAGTASGILLSFPKKEDMYRYILLLLLVSTFTVAQRKPKDDQQPAPAAPAVSGLDARLKGLVKYPGFIEYYLDEKQDKIFLLIDNFGTEFLYIESLTSGLGSNDIGLDRNQLGNERIVKFDRRGPKVLMLQPNYFYRANSTNELERKAVEQSFAQSVLFGFTVAAEENGKVLVDATDFLLQDAHEVAARLRSSNQGNFTIDKNRSALYLPRTKNFPDNSEFEVTLTFSGQAAGAFVQSVTPTPSSLTLRQHLSFVRLPDANYQPRRFDPRAGYFSTSYYDYATPISESLEKRWITRHRLQKKDPAAAVSEAVKPITYYLDPGVPEPIRSALLEGARWWNQAFEAAGFKDAFRVELLPADADPMDIRYNMINWIHRSTRGWSYGSSVVDPRTGEIIKGHVALGSLRVRQDFLIAEGLLAPYEEGKPASKEMEQMALSRLRQLAAHEVGHTLGLSHAYSSSSENLASVMDYPHPVVKITDGKIDLSKAYDDKIGAFDKVSITYGYAQFPPGADETVALEGIIQKSLKEGLTFLSDQDARPMGSAHPYAHLWDNGADAADELNRVMSIRSLALKNLGERNIKPGAPMATLEEVFVPMYFFHRYQTEAAAKMIGGLNYRYALRGDGQPVAQLLSPQQELKALEALMKTVDPAALLIPESLLQQIPPRPLGYTRHRELVKSRTDLAFDPLGAAETAADLTFGLIFYPPRANRVFEHHAREAKLPSLEAIIDRLAAVTVRSATKSGYEGAVQMAVQNAFIVNLIKLGLSKDAAAPVRGVALLKLEQFEALFIQRRLIVADEEWKGFYVYLLSQIKNMQENPEEFKVEALLPAPPGQPIGSDAMDCDW